MRYISVFIIWILFWLAGIIALPVALLFGLFGKTKYASDVFHAQNRTAAAFIGFGGDNTISRECGERGTCVLLCKILSWALQDPEHCKNELNR